MFCDSLFADSSVVHAKERNGRANRLSFADERNMLLLNTSVPQPGCTFRGIGAESSIFDPAPQDFLIIIFSS